jgi:hypothetical protein
MIVNDKAPLGSVPVADLRGSRQRTQQCDDTVTRNDVREPAGSEFYDGADGFAARMGSKPSLMRSKL